MIFISFIVQVKGSSQIEEKCSYLDPITIDILAFFVAIFLIVEGYHRINEHKNMSFKNQFTRSIRVVIGFAILTFILFR